jgi:FkbM family methyltransferase
MTIKFKKVAVALFLLGLCYPTHLAYKYYQRCTYLPIRYPHISANGFRYTADHFFDQPHKIKILLSGKSFSPNSVKNGDTIFDIGANIGWYTNHLSKKLPKSQIYSFEPIPETFSQLKNNTIINDSKNVILNNIALSAKIETLSFYYSPTVTGASSTRNITDNLNMFRLECNANTIDNYMSQNNIEKLDFVKCDVEGAEYFVFQGGKDTFKNHLPIVFTEMLRKWAKKFDYHPNDIINYLSQFGYKCFICSKGKLKSIECIYDSTLETNFFFLHPTKHINILNSII